MNLRHSTLAASIAMLMLLSHAAAQPATMTVNLPAPPAKANETAAFVPTAKTQPVNPFTGEAAEVDSLNRLGTTLRAKREVAQIESEIATFKQSTAKAGGASVVTRSTAVTDFKDLTAPGTRRPTTSKPRPASKQPELPVKVSAVSSFKPSPVVSRPFSPRVVAVMRTVAGHSAMVEVAPGKVEQFSANSSRAGIAIGQIDASSAELNGRRSEVSHDTGQIALVASNQRAVGVQPTIVAPGASPPAAASPGFVIQSGLPSPGQPVPTSIGPPPLNSTR